MRSSFQIYIDNLDEYEVVDIEVAETLTGMESPCAERSESFYEALGTPGNAKKNFQRVDVMTTLGVTTRGREGIRHCPRRLPHTAQCLHSLFLGPRGGDSPTPAGACRPMGPGATCTRDLQRF